MEETKEFLHPLQCIANRSLDSLFSDLEVYVPTLEKQKYLPKAWAHLLPPLVSNQTIAQEIAAIVAWKRAASIAHEGAELCMHQGLSLCHSGKMTKAYAVLQRGLELQSSPTLRLQLRNALASA